MTAPGITARDAIADRDWFTNHPYRRYRLRKTNGDWWVIRRRTGSVLLRARITTALPRGLPDADKALRAIWVAAAWAGFSPTERAALEKQIRKGEKLHEI